MNRAHDTYVMLMLSRHDGLQASVMQNILTMIFEVDDITSEGYFYVCLKTRSPETVKSQIQTVKNL